MVSSDTGAAVDMALTMAEAMAVAAAAAEGGDVAGPTDGVADLVAVTARVEAAAAVTARRARSATKRRMVGWRRGDAAAAAAASSEQGRDRDRGEHEAEAGVSSHGIPCPESVVEGPQVDIFFAGLVGPPAYARAPSPPRNETGRMLSAIPLSSYNHRAPEVPPPLCDFVEWIDKEMDEFHSGMIRQWRERKEEREERQRERAVREKAERERREELELRELARQNREKEERGEDRARKLARAQHAKDAGSEAARKGKYPRARENGAEPTNLSATRLGVEVGLSRPRPSLTLAPLLKALSDNMVGKRDVANRSNRDRQRQNL
uniref:Uncharacterized protein n=1 Tax=Oryza punctata TaxID=4537 RepID=A0A0E0LNE1_ORYPU